MSIRISFIPLLRCYKLRSNVWVISLLCCISISAVCQSHQYLDSLVEMSKTQYRNHTFNAITNLQNGFQLVEKSKQANYSKGMVNGYLAVAEILSRAGEYEKSMQYTQKALEQTSYLDKTPTDHFYVLMLQSENYHYLGLNALASALYFKALTVIQQEKDERLKATGIFYHHMACFIVTDDPELQYQYYCKADSIASSETYKSRNAAEEAYNKQDKALLYVSLGDYRFHHKSLDSAEHYYQTALRLLEGAGSHNYQSFAYDGLGDVHAALGNHQQAVVYYKKSADISLQLQLNEEVQEVYRKLIRVFGLLNDNQSILEYQRLYDQISDSLSLFRAKGRDYAVLKMVENYEQAWHKARSNNRLLYGSLIAVLTLAVVTVYGIRKKHTAQPGILLQPKEKQPEDTPSILKEEEHQGALPAQAHSFDSLLQLAKDNHPSFYSRFQEVHEDIHRKLLELNPALQLSELTLCAYIYLDFSTKDIATYTNRSVRTVQTRKYTLRKKLYVAGSVDLYVWIKNLNKNNGVDHRSA